MEFIINKDNYKQFVRTDNFLVIDNEFVTNNSLQVCSKITVEDVKDNKLLLDVSKVDLPKTRLEVNECIFTEISIKDSTIGEIIFNNVEVNEPIEGKLSPFKVFVDNSKLKYLWFYYCKLYNGIIIRKDSLIESLSINDTLVDRSFTFINSKCKTITVESSNVSEISIDRNDYPKKYGKTEVDTINIFRTEGLKNIKISEVLFKEIHIHKIILNKTNRLTDHNNEIYIRIPDGNKEVEEIKITESSINSKTVIVFDKAENVKIFDSNLGEVFLNYWHISNLLFSNCKFGNSIYFGSPNQIKIINKLLIENCSFDDIFNMSSIWFKEGAFFRGLVFNKYPSFFYHNAIDETCKTDFQYSNLQNLVFQDIDFSYFSFKEFDITNVEFRDCSWISERKYFVDRNIVIDDNENINKIDDLLKVKDIYLKLKMSTEKSSDFINRGKFYISEQEVKRKIHRKKGDLIEFWLMGFHKTISSYGENFKKPLFFALCSTVFFAFIFLFTGFYLGDTLIKYEFTFESSNTLKTLNDFLYSLIYSFKNILPFQVSSNFYLHTDISLSITQTLELTQRIINLILATSFTAAFIKYLRK